MPRAVPSARIIGRIQRLCLFGSGGLSMFPDILRELSREIPSRIGPAVFHQGDRFLTTAAYSEDPACLAAHRTFIDEFEETELEGKVARLEPELFPTYRYSPVTEYVERRVKVDRDEWLRSDLYNIVFKPIGMERSVCMSVAGRKDLLAALIFPRSATDPAFTPREVRLLEALVPFIAHAVTERPPQGPFVETDHRALLTVDADGAIRNVSSQAESLLAMAQVTSKVPLVVAARRAGLPAEVARLVRSVGGWSEDNPLAVPPAWRCRNGWGEFVFRVYRMEQMPGLPSSRLLGVSIERREPLRLKLLRRLGELPLSVRETELCLALLDGDSRGAIAERLRISVATAITHCRNLYGKLDVHNRMELVESCRRCEGRDRPVMRVRIQLRHPGDVLAVTMRNGLRTRAREQRRCVAELRNHAR